MGYKGREGRGGNEDVQWARTQKYEQNFKSK